jgi:hypothetical protein
VDERIFHAFTQRTLGSGIELAPIPGVDPILISLAPLLQLLLFQNITRINRKASPNFPLTFPRHFYSVDMA